MQRVLGGRAERQAPPEEALKNCIQRRIVVLGERLDKENATCVLSTGMWDVGREEFVLKGAPGAGDWT